jgi:NADH-quinone oxidoreductase subunit C
MPTEGQKKLLEELKNSLTRALPEGRITSGDYSRTGCHLEVRLSDCGMRRIAREMKERRFHLETITAVDFLGSFELIYLYSTWHDDICRVIARIQILKDALPNTVSAIYPGAIWLEREIYDFFGIRFLNHPDLRRILNPDNADYFPLLKTFGKTKLTEEIDDILC